MHKKVFALLAFALLLIGFGAFHFSKIIGLLGVVFVSFSNVLRLILSNPSGITDIALRVWFLFLYGLGFKKWKHPWGTVYDSETKEPVHGVRVYLLDIDNKVIAKSITDTDGRYGFLVDPGFYHITVKKKGYVFPSSTLFGKGKDEVYNNLYFGNFIEIKRSGDVITKNIPMYRPDFSWSQFREKEQNKFHFYHSGDKALGQIINITFIAGFLTSIIVLIGQPIKTYNVIILLVYMVVFFINRKQFGRSAEGTVFFKNTNLPVAYGLLRIKSESGLDITHKVISRIGKYYCLLPDGLYNVTIEKKNSDGSYTNVYEEKGVEAQKGYLKRDFKV